MSKHRTCCNTCAAFNRLPNGYGICHRYPHIERKGAAAKCRHHDPESLLSRRAS